MYVQGVQSIPRINVCLSKKRSSYVPHDELDNVFSRMKTWVCKVMREEVVSRDSSASKKVYNFLNMCVVETW